MLSLSIKDLSFLIVSDLAAKYPDEQFLPIEMNDALLAIINGVGLASLNVAVDTAQRAIELGEDLASLPITKELETVERFATIHVSRGDIVSLIMDMSGLDAGVSELILTLVEAAVDERVFGLKSGVPVQLEFEGLGIIGAGSGTRSYHIDLAAALHIPPLRYVSLLPQLLGTPNSASAS